jgi:hypothetical protein
VEVVVAIGGDPSFVLLGVVEEEADFTLQDELEAVEEGVVLEQGVHDADVGAKDTKEVESS